MLIPEISLTPQTVSKFSARFGSLVAVLHSSLSMTERFDEWQRIRSGAARIVVGTRSAVMAPLENIGLIVIDEEQEHTYHSESAPRYHARDIAKHRAVRHVQLDEFPVPLDNEIECSPRLKAIITPSPGSTISPVFPSGIRAICCLRY